MVFRLHSGGINKKRYIPKRNSPELAIQRRVCTYLKDNYPDVIFHSDYSAGLHLTQNQAKINKSLQSSAGMPDLYILKPSRGYNGLFIELKADGVTVILKTGKDKGKLTSDLHIRQQAVILRRFNELGYYANFAVGYESAVAIIDWYMDRPKNTSLF